MTNIIYRFARLLLTMAEQNALGSDLAGPEGKGEATTLTTELAKYQILLDNAAKSSTAELVPNSGKEHAALMMSKMFQSASSSISIVAGNFCGEISDNNKYLDSLHDALQRGVKTQIIVLGMVNPESKAFAMLKSFVGKNVEIYQGNQKTKEVLQTGLKSPGREMHLAVFDDDKFRLEINPEIFSAMGGFNHPLAKQLKSIFANAITASTKYPA